MDRVSRLIFAFCLFCVSIAVSAQVTYTVTFGGVSATASTVDAAAASVASQKTAQQNVACVTSGGIPRGYTSYSVLSVVGLVVRFRATYGGDCNIAPYDPPPVTAVRNGQVTCPSHQEIDPDTQVCTCRAIPKAGSFMVTGDHYDGCNNGCAMVLSSGWYDKTANTTWGSWSQSGFACTAGTPSVLTSNDPKVEAAKQCAAGTCPGTVNGQSVCVPCDKTKQTESSSSSTSASTTASGATSSTTTTGSESGTSRTECKDGQCTTTTTTTTTGANGDKTDKTTTTSEPQSDYCTRNPKADVCKGTESTWGGSCGAFTCDGDAVQCAQAKAGWELACGLKVDETNPLIGVGQQATAGGDRPSDHPGNQANTIALDLSSRLSSVPLFGTSGDCIADKTITFMGKGYTLPFSKWCPYLNILGSAFLAACYLAAAFIIFRD